MDPHRVLGVKEGASKAEIRSAYLKLAKELHPDVNPTPAGTEMMRLVNLAYEELSGAAVSYDPPRGRQAWSPEPCAICATLLRFGKYKGQAIAVVWANDPGYINWCVNTFEVGNMTRETMLEMLEHQRGGVWPQ